MAVHLLSEFCRARFYLEGLETAPTHSPALGRTRQDLADCLELLKGSMSNPDAISQFQLLYFAEEDNMVWIEKVFGQESAQERGRLYWALGMSLTREIEGLYKRWHEYSGLRLDDHEALAKLSTLLHFLAHRWQVALPERPVPRLRRPQNYEAVDWSQFVEELAAKSVGV